MADFHRYVVSRSKSGGKFWEVEVDGDQVKVRYGKIGRDSKWSVKSHPTPEKALADAQKKLSQKMKKGYTEELESWDLATCLDEMEVALNEASWVHLVQFERGAPLSDEALAEVEASLGWSLAPEFVEFFRVCNGLRVLWLSEPPEEAEPTLDYRRQLEERHHVGSINIPSLKTLFTFNPYVYGEDCVAPKSYHECLLGGWDSNAIRRCMRSLDDYMETPSDYSYYLLGMVAHSRYPDPPVVMTSDAAACIEDNHPMLARHYLQMVVATMGLQHVRFDCMRGRGFGGNHELFLPLDNWMDGFPSPKDVLSCLYSGSPAQVRTQLDGLGEMGQNASKSAYAYYNEPPPASDVVVSEDPLEGMWQRKRTDETSFAYPAFDGDVLTIPLFDPSHYAVNDPLDMANIDVGLIRPLIGEPVKVEDSLMGMIVGCLISVFDDGRLVLYSESKSSGGTAACSLERLESIGRAWAIED